MQTSETMNRTVYHLCWVFLCLIPIVFFGMANIPMLHDFIFSPCVVYHTTGLFCPGCGGTRSVIALLTGHPIKSLLFHPFVIYFTICFLLFFSTQSLSRLTGGRVSGINYRNIYVFIGIGIIMIQWIVKNIILLVTGVNYFLMF